MTFKEALFNLNPENCYRIGVILKSHAYKGQISAKVFIDLKKIQEEPILVKIDDYLVPFFVDYSNCNLETYPAILKLKNIDSIDEVDKIKASEIFVPKNVIENIEEEVIDFENFIIGYNVYEDNGNLIGTIAEFIDNKNNPLFVLKNQKKEILLPINAVEYSEINHSEKRISLILPDNFLELL